MKLINFSPNIETCQQIVLGSQSPRRRLLLSRTGLNFTVQPSAYHEPPPAADDEPADYVLRNARLKALDVHQQNPDALVIGADTIVVLDRHILGKPDNQDGAVDMLRRLSGRTHEVMTGVAVVGKADIPQMHVEISAVTFRPLTDADIADYAATGSPMDKAGAYGIQDGARQFVRYVRGCIFNVIGLPLAAVWNLLNECGD
jgi:septum formation protein